MQSMAHVSGTLNPAAGIFKMNAQEQGGRGRTATISGSVEANGYLVVPTSIAHGASRCSGSP
jgi:hypothetical protein